MLYKIWLILTCENSFQDGIIQKRLGITDQSLVKHKGIIGGPFTWSNKRKRIVQISNPRKFIYHYKCLLFYVAVLSIKAIFHHHFSQLVPLKLVIMHLYTAITHTIILTVPYLDPRKCVQCFNSFLYFCLKFKAKNLPRLNMNTDQMSRNMTKFILAFTLAFGNVPSFEQLEIADCRKSSDSIQKRGNSSSCNDENLWPSNSPDPSNPGKWDAVSVIHSYSTLEQPPTSTIIHACINCIDCAHVLGSGSSDWVLLLQRIEQNVDIMELQRSIKNAFQLHQKIQKVVQTINM
ncbi:uncharacterized protein LOC110847659 isoform X4 [Folsomia candida]|uniref:uncharacterized protein LOC110847659 isoform X4 n=1 Tax=Folsomia candida TaxID=158441 RepID=UPI001604B387|nr:uncharacterized protein LOC110847659 isoform X4 [Folsomia candida]